MPQHANAREVAAVAPARRVSTPVRTSAHEGKRRERREKAFDESGAPGNRQPQQLARRGAPPRLSPKQARKDLDGESDAIVAAVDLREQQLAKEQLMLALRLTSSKLSIVQRKARGTTDSKPAPEEQQKLR